MLWCICIFCSAWHIQMCNLMCGHCLVYFLCLSVSVYRCLSFSLPFLFALSLPLSLFFWGVGGLGRGSLYGCGLCLHICHNIIVANTNLYQARWGRGLSCEVLVVMPTWCLWLDICKFWKKRFCCSLCTIWIYFALLHRHWWVPDRQHLSTQVSQCARNLFLYL